MNYGVQFRSMHSGVHGVFVCNEIEKAETVLGVLKQLYRGKTDAEDVELILNNLVYGERDEIDYRKVQEEMEIAYTVNKNGTVIEEEGMVTFINANQAVDVYEF